FLIDWLNLERPWDEMLCDEVLKREHRLRRAPFLNYEYLNHRHQLLCESCRSAAPIVFALSESIADEQFRRMRVFLANLVECLDFGDLKIKKLVAALALPNGYGPIDQNHGAFGASMRAEEKLK